VLLGNLTGALIGPGHSASSLFAVSGMVHKITETS
jgi:hypothetical protein